MRVVASLAPAKDCETADTIQAVPPTHQFIVGIGGTARPGSSTECALRFALAAAESAGASTRMFGGEQLIRLPHYDPSSSNRIAGQQELVAAVRRADGLILATPGYHGGVSGLIKNALDLLEDLRDEPAPYLSGRAVGCIVTGFGWQTCGTTLMAMRAIVHALRGWPTPLGAALNVSQRLFDADGVCVDSKAASQIATVAHQVVRFAAACPDRAVFA